MNRKNMKLSNKEIILKLKTFFFNFYDRPFDNLLVIKNLTNRSIFLFLVFFNTKLNCRILEYVFVLFVRIIYD